MTLIATATIDAVDTSAVDGEVVIRAIAESDAISASTEGSVTSIEVLIKCPTDPGLKVGGTLTVSSHFVALDPNAPTTPANAVGPEATEPATDSAAPTETATDSDGSVAEPVGAAETPVVDNGSAGVDASVPAAAGPGDDASAPAAADTSGTPLAPAEGAPAVPDPTSSEASVEAAPDTSVPADGSQAVNPGVEATPAQVDGTIPAETEPASAPAEADQDVVGTPDTSVPADQGTANPDYVAPLADASTPAAPTVPPIS